MLLLYPKHPLYPHSSKTKSVNEFGSKIYQTLMSVQDAIVFGLENKFMIRKSTWEAYCKYPKAFSLPSNWQELEVFFFLLLCHVALVTGNDVVATKGKRKRPSAFKQRHEFSLKAAVCGPVGLGD